MGILTVYLDRATKLKDKDTIGKSDPYIKFELEQNNTFKDKNYGDQKSTTKKNDLDPVYEETFHFNIPEIKNMELTVKVMDDDVLKDDKMGKCKIKLEKLGLSDSPTPLREKVYNRVFGDDSYVFLTLTYTE